MDKKSGRLKDIVSWAVVLSLLAGIIASFAYVEPLMSVVFIALLSGTTPKRYAWISLIIWGLVILCPCLFLLGLALIGRAPPGFELSLVIGMAFIASVFFVASQMSYRTRNVPPKPGHISFFYTAPKIKAAPPTTIQTAFGEYAYPPYHGPRPGTQRVELEDSGDSDPGPMIVDIRG